MEYRTIMKADGKPRNSLLRSTKLLINLGSMSCEESYKHSRLTRRDEHGLAPDDMSSAGGCSSICSVSQIAGLLLIHRLYQNCGENRLKRVLAPKRATSPWVMLFRMRETGRPGMSTHDSELVRFAPTPKSLPGYVDQVDKAGETILQLLHKAAGVADQNSSRALTMAQRFSD